MSRDAAHRYVVAYDVTDDGRRSRIATRLSTFGDRLQYSVFVIDGRPAKLVRLRRELARLIDPQLDSVLICDLGLPSSDDGARFQVIGRRRPITDTTTLVL